MKNNVVLKYLQDEKYTFIQTDYDLQSVLDYVGIKEDWRNDITGAILLVGDGEYIAVWLTESPRYYDLSAIYHPLPYYQDDNQDSQFLPEYWQKDNTEYNL